MAPSFLPAPRTPRAAATALRRRADVIAPHDAAHATELRQLAARLLAALNLE